MKRSLFWEALEVAAKATVVGAQVGRDAIRTGFGVVGALTDCGMRGPAVRWADALADKEAEEDVAEPNPLAGLAARMDRFEAIMLAQAVHEAPLSADFDDECPQALLSPYCFVGSSYCLHCPHAPAVSATDSAVEDPSPDVPPASGEADSSWIDYVTPAICDVLAEHLPYQYHDHGFVWCMNSEGHNHATHGDWSLYDWRNHVAPLIAERIQAVTLELPEAK